MHCLILLFTALNLLSFAHCNPLWVNLNSLDHENIRIDIVIPDTKTATIFFYPEPDFTGDGQSFEVNEDTCTTIPEPAAGNAASVHFSHNVWYCDFFSDRVCKGDKLAKIGQSGYADLEEVGKWFKSVQCAFYDMSLSPAEISRMKSTFFVKGLSSSGLEGMSGLEI
ncbi:hypothetical protein IFR05_002800 [Cadophora sp. M221]|nr:hypothetical protein IFR05_002800 [Cadophora sp. M221]